jgi:hypothetical protein
MFLNILIKTHLDPEYLIYYPEYPGPTTKKYTTFTIQGQDIPYSV